MIDDSLDELGPVDYTVIEFPAGTASFSGEMANELLSLAEAEIITILDVLVIEKDENGVIEALEIDETDFVDEIRALETAVAEILAEEDVEHLAAAMAPGTRGLAVIWENTWAAPFGSAARRAGGELVASGRIPIQAIIASIEAAAATETEGV